VNVAQKKLSKGKKIVRQEEKPEQPSVVFLDERANKPVSLILLGVIAVIMGFLSKTPIMAKTILSAPADIMVIFGLIGIVVGLVLNYRRTHPVD
jgi:hypothetical protein